MAEMPIIPGLAGGGDDDEGAAPAAGGGDVAGALSLVPDDELEQLEAAAAQASASGELDHVLSGDGDADGEHDEASETPDEEIAESDEQQAEEEDEGVEDPTPHVRAAEDAYKAADAARTELARLVDEAGEHEGAGLDVDSLQELLDEAEEACKEAEQANDDAHATEDAEEAAEHAKDAQEAQATCEQALAEAKQKVQADTARAADEAIPDEVRAMTAWARQQVGG